MSKIMTTAIPADGNLYKQIWTRVLKSDGLLNITPVEFLVTRDDLSDPQFETIFLERIDIDPLENLDYED